MLIVQGYVEEVEDRNEGVFTADNGQQYPYDYVGVVLKSPEGLFYCKVQKVDPREIPAVGEATSFVVMGQPEREKLGWVLKCKLPSNGQG